MNRKLKRALFIGGMVAVGVQSFRSYRVFKEIKPLEKELSEYLHSLYGETPEFHSSMIVNLFINVDVTVLFSPEFLAIHTDVEEVVRQYLSDNCPMICKSRLTVIVEDNTMSKAEIIKKHSPKMYKLFGPLIEKKLKVAEAKETPKE
ncbi:MAG: hypothetical protein PHO32_07770 [Candidatus Cloacimonetes bacterium]|nr:hypothetical protein [Candidatus Cloacimonadota bacterium]